MKSSLLDEEPTLHIGPAIPGAEELAEVFVGRYLRLETLGEGGMGIVCRCFDIDLEETVALKLLRPDLARDATIRDRFRREVKLARRVTHPNVARVFEFGRDGSLYFLTMEYVPGESLQALLLREAPLTEERTLELAFGLCEGLAAAHAAGVIHGDIKPANVLVAPGRGAVLTDFGIAQALTDAVLGERNVSGTPLYMAPEQARGEPLGPQTDVYAVGVVLFAALTGTAPWPRGDVNHVILRKRRGHEPNIEHLAPEMPAGWRALITDCLRADPRLRPTDARALLDRLSWRRDMTTRASQPAYAPELMSGQGLRWLIVEPLKGPASFEWVRADLVEALSQTRGLRVVTGGSVPSAAAHTVRVEGEVLAGAAGVIVTLQLCEGPNVRAALDVQQPRATWHRLGDELAARIAGELGGAPPAQPSSEALDDATAELYILARRAYQALRFSESRERFAAALRRAPQNPALQTGHALARMQETLLRPDCTRADIAALRADVDELVERHPDLGEAHLARARITLAFGEFESCARSLRAAIDRAPSRVEAHVLLADLLLEIGRLPDAARRLDIALALDRYSPHAWNVRLRQWAYEGRWEEIDAAIHGVLKQIAFRTPMVVRLLLWRPDREPLEQLDAIFQSDEDRLPEPMRKYGGYLLNIGLGRGDRTAQIEALGVQGFGSAHQRFRRYYTQIKCELHAAVGDRERAFAYLHEAVDRLDIVDWQWLRCCPLLRSLADDPRHRQACEIVRARADALAEAIWG